MIKKIVFIFLFFFLPNTLFPQLNIVKSIKVKSEGHLKSNFIFDKNDVININFDILDKKKDDINIYEICLYVVLVILIFIIGIKPGFILN